MTGKEKSRDLFSESAEELTLKRIDLNVEVFICIAEQKFREAIAKLNEIAQIDQELEGEITNGTLFRLADAHAGLKDWPRAAEVSFSLKEQIARQRDRLEEKIRQGIALTEAEEINYSTLPQLLAVTEKRFPLYRDYNERIVSLKNLLKERLSSSGESIQENVINLRYKLFLQALPGAFQQAMEEAISSLLERLGNVSKGSVVYRQIIDIVFSYVVSYVMKVDPENERFLIDPIFYEDLGEDLRNLKKVENPLAWEERIKNRAEKIMDRKRQFISENQDIFAALENKLEQAFHHYD